MLVALVVLVSAGGNATAWAHAGGLTSAASEARVLALDPPRPGLVVTAVEFGARLRLDNGTGDTVVVEPLPGSVRSGLPVVPPGGRAYWSDPRVAAAAATPRPTADRLAWMIPLRVGGAAMAVRGEQYWPPPPSPLWWAGALLALVVPAAAGALLTGRRSGRVALAGATLAVLVAHLGHALGSAGVPEDRPYPSMLLSAVGFALLGWPLGVLGAWTTLRGRAAGPLLCCATGGLFALVIAPADVFTLVDAVVPFAWGADLDRALVAGTLGGGLGVVIAGMAVLRREPVRAGA